MKTQKLYCFSPGVMLATFSVEIFLFAYVLFRYRWSKVVWLAAFLLFFLAGFQLAEYALSVDGLIVDSNVWARLAFVSITMLPPLGFHLMLLLAAKKSSNRNQHLMSIALNYAVALIFISYFAILPSSVLDYEFANNYAMFHIPSSISWLYGLYYWGVLLETLSLGAFFIYKKKLNKARLAAVSWFTFGYLSFMVPTVVLVFTIPDTARGIPSIMCGFAAILALILSFAVLPKVASRR